MTKRLLIDARQAEETRVALLSGTRIEDFDYETKNRIQLKGNVYLAKVTRVEPSLQAAFIEYGGNRQGFLAFSEIHPDYYRIPVEDREALIEANRVDEEEENPEAKEEITPETVGGEGTDEDYIRPKRQVKKYKIQEVISRKQILLVQIVKEERGTKGAALTTYLSLAGRYCVLMPNNNRGGGVSRKITNLTDRKRLRTVVGGLNIQEGMSVIVRTAGAKRTKAEITRDFTYMSKLWDEIRAHTLESQAPSLIHEEGGLIKRSVRDLYTNEVDEVLVEGDEAYKIARSQMKMLIPSHLKKVKKYEGEQPIFQNFDIESQMDTIHNPQVTLRSGGYLVINQTEALVAIDVNSGKSTRERNIEETAIKTNLEAADELGRQLRLRDLSGLIVVDFIDMEETRNQHAVERRMKDAMRNDRARIQIGSISHFGLLEMSRQRLRLSINESINNLCPHCEGSGLIRSIDSAALQLLRSVEEELQKGKMNELHITAHRNVVLFVLNRKRSTIAEIEKRFGVSIFLLSDDNLIAPEYKVERIGWQGKSQTKQSSNNLQNQKKNEKKSRTDENENDTDDKVNTDSSSKPDNTDIENEDEGQKRRRRGRRGGRRRRRRNNEDAQVQDSEIETNQTDNSEKSEINDEKSSENTKHAFKGTSNQSVKEKAGHRRAIAAAQTVSDNQSETDDMNSSAAINDETVNKPPRKQKKSVDNSNSSSAEPNKNKVQKNAGEDKVSSGTKRITKKIARPQKSKAKDKTSEDGSSSKQKTTKKEATKKVAKKALAKPKTKREVRTDENEVEGKQSISRETISSAPEDVIEIGSSALKAPKRGWWSRK